MTTEPWRVEQYCYFWLASDQMTARDITERVGIEPDRTTIMASRRSAPTPVPAAHRWEIRCEEHGRIDQQASAVLARVEPAADAIRALVEGGDVHAGLMMVRWFDDPEGGYNAMSWWLSSQQVQLLAHMGAGIESDEYAGDFTSHSPG